MKIWNRKQSEGFLGDDACCDSSSRLFGISKGPLRSSFHGCIKADIIKAGEEALKCLYGGLPPEGLDILLWRKLKSIVITGITLVQVKSLPPTSDSGQFRSLQVYYQKELTLSSNMENFVQFNGTSTCT
ncbi:Hypothetical predicted protein [Mytilus galloprovincialis]|uniref:Uncharacterized protein n=1 Tax=Mytilus galloprovincialis TaxID=29158 RepID=A0A8B6FY44_MYTGA|nr:Hypothetical predicted protein [Mytilus galloprovincialis]